MTLHTSTRLESGLDRLWAAAYVSTPTVPFSDRDLSDLLRSARLVNARLGVTGKLVVLEDGDAIVRFAQWIEGPRLELDVCLQRIVGDPRHGDIDIRFQGPIPARRFAGWDMAMASADRSVFATEAADLTQAA